MGVVIMEMWVSTALGAGITAAAMMGTIEDMALSLVLPLPVARANPARTVEP